MDVVSNFNREVAFLNGDYFGAAPRCDPPDRFRSERRLWSLCADPSLKSLRRVRVDYPVGAQCIPDLPLDGQTERPLGDRGKSHFRCDKRQRCIRQDFTVPHAS